MCLARFANASSLVMIHPPPPLVMILLPLKLIAATSPNVPVCLPLYHEPKLSAASSTSLICHLSQISLITSILQGCPKVCIGTHALITLFVVLLIHSTFLTSQFSSKNCSNDSGLSPSVSLSTSTNTGFAPQ